jgi:hypothetical protein
MILLLSIRHSMLLYSTGFMLLCFSRVLVYEYGSCRGVEDYNHGLVGTNPRLHIDCNTR